MPLRGQLGPTLSVSNSNFYLQLFVDTALDRAFGELWKATTSYIITLT